MNHFLDIHLTDPSDLRQIIDQAAMMKTNRAGRPRGARDDDAPLKDRMVALIFEKPSTRTRVSFDVGVRQIEAEVGLLFKRSDGPLVMNDLFWEDLESDIPNDGPEGICLAMRSASAGGKRRTRATSRTAARAFNVPNVMICPTLSRP